MSGSSGYRPRYVRVEPAGRRSRRPLSRVRRPSSVPSPRGGWPSSKVGYAVLGGILLASAAVGGVVATGSHHAAAASPTPAAAAPPTGRVDAAVAGAPSPVTTSAGAARGAAQRAVQALLDRAAAADRTAAGAVDEATHCNALPAAVQALDRAVVARQGILDDLGHVRAADLPGGAAMLADLNAAQQAAMAGDSAYGTWAEDLELRCLNPTTDDPYHAAAVADMRAAGAATARFRARWSAL